MIIVAICMSRAFIIKSPQLHHAITSAQPAFGMACDVSTNSCVHKQEINLSNLTQPEEGSGLENNIQDVRAHIALLRYGKRLVVSTSCMQGVTNQHTPAFWLGDDTCI